MGLLGLSTAVSYAGTTYPVKNNNTRAFFLEKNVLQFCIIPDTWAFCSISFVADLL